MNILDRIKSEFKETPDLIIKKVDISSFKTIYVLYLESISSSDKVNDYILKNIILKKNKINKHNLESFIAGPNTIKITEYDKIEYFLTNGFTIIIFNEKIFAVETKADINRSISQSDIESSINGPKDSFNENIQMNLGLVKRRIKSNTLITSDKVIGRKTKTKVSILYFDDIVDQNIVDNLNKKLDSIDIDGIIDSSTIGYFLDGERKSVYPTVMQSERPDIVVTALLEGKIAIMVDTCPSVLILPAFFIDFINPNIDNYNKSGNINFVKILRLVSFFISIMLPGIYIAIMNHNQETIPTSLLLNFAIQRDGVPFPTILETMLMLIVCDILRESDLRFPSNYGSAISILGAIVLGEASVNAGVVSPITIIIVAISFISSLTFTNIEMNNALRYFRYIFIFSAGLFGLYGIFLGLFYFLIYTTNTKTLSKPYFAPISPYEKTYFKNSVIKGPINKDTKRSNLFTNKNLTKQKEDL